MKDGFIYMLRFAAQPGHHEQARFEKLIDFCKAARIDDVMFFINGEELNNGHLTRDETRPWMEMIARGKALLEPLGITTSINPWPSLLHGARGRTLRDGQRFTLMADQHGNTTTAVACPLCPEWRSYISDIYACYAEIMPEVLWVEDDFRLHNHRPLDWGGCFCNRHMEEYSQRAGRKLSRDEFIEGVLRPGEPHSFRKIWLDTARDVMVENARMIGDAVRNISPCTRVGLMSSDPYVHCAEGRDWTGILSGLAAGNEPVIRPTLSIDVEVTPQEYLQGMAANSMLTAAMLPDGTQIYPELESFPHSRFSKSRVFTGFQLQTSLTLGAQGITLNLFDMMGNGILPQERYQHVLSGEKDFLNAVKALGLKADKREGVQVLVSPLSSRTLHTRKGKSMEELYPQETFWARLLSAIGVAYAYCVDGDPKNQVVAVSGQYFRKLGGEGLERLFARNFVLMDGEAAHTLCDMGYGALAGIRCTTWHPMESGFQAWEQACSGKSYAGVEEARISCQTSVGDYVEISYSEAARLLSKVMNPKGEAVGAGMAIVDGRTIVLPYSRFGSIQGHLTPIRQDMLQTALTEIDGVYARPAIVFGEPDISIHIYHMEGGKAAVLTNFSLDAIPELKLRIPGADAGTVMKLDRASAKAAAADIRREGDTLVLQGGLGALETVVLLYGTSGEDGVLSQNVKSNE